MSKEIENAVIQTATLTTETYGCLTGWLNLEFGKFSQGFGGTILQVPQSSDHWTLGSPAGHWIMRIMEIAGVENWKDLPGKTIRVIRKDNRITAVGHIVEDDWFDPEVDFADFQGK